jgi:hypothetical protein
MTFRALLLLILAHLNCLASEATPRLPDGVFAHVGDYCFAYRELGMVSMDGPDLSPLTFRASRYVLRFSQDRLAIETLAPLASAPGLEAIMAARPPAMVEVAGWNFALSLCSGQRRWPVTAGPTLQRDQQVVEVGQFFQRRFLKALTLATGAPVLSSRDSGLEIAAWPDTLSWRWHVNPTTAIAEGAAEMRLTPPPGWSLTRSQDAIVALAEDGNGFLILASAQSTLADDPASRVITATLAPADWPANRERSVGLRLIALHHATPAQIARLIDDERKPLSVTATQIMPDQQRLPVTYDGDLGSLTVAQPDTRKRMPINDAFVRLRLDISNPDRYPRIARLDLAAHRELGMAGMSNLLTDAAWTPIGVPLQITKDWHDNLQDRFMGPWAHRLTMVTIPAASTVTLGVTQAYAFWGGVPAASVSHLSCVGYPANQQNWGEAALGAWQESMTFWPSPPPGWAHICDVRAPLASPTGKPEWGWTGNVGGGSWLRYEVDGQPIGITQVRDHYEAQTPNLATVTYAGLTADHAIASRVTASILRSDDYVRVILRLHFEALRDTVFSRLAWFQLGADAYNYAVVNAVAHGDADGLAEAWPLTDQQGLVRQGQPRSGRLPWFSLHDTQVNRHRHEPKPGEMPKPCLHDQATRGLLVRSWTGLIDGKPVSTPDFAIRGHTGFSSTALVELTPPSGTARLRSGDYLDAVLEWIVLPSGRMTYYGPNRAFAAAHAADGDGWKLVHREAAGTALRVEASAAEVVGTYPIHLRANGVDPITCTVHGGLGWVPLTIDRLPGFDNPVLEQHGTGGWQPVTQAVHGQDWWQTRFDAATRTWEITYNLPMDGAVAEERRYRFSIQPHAFDVKATP